METQAFGVKLRELRIQARLTQRDLANKVNIDFSYLSKIENGILPPPSEKVILRLAEALHADRDELLTLAGRIPADIAQMLKSREALQFLRSDSTQKKIRSSSQKEGRAHIVDEIKSLPTLAKTKIPINLTRVVIATILVIAVGAAIWFASPNMDTAIAANKQGVVYNNNGEHDKAIIAFTKAIELDPKFALAYSNRGWAYMDLGQYEQGIADSNKAIELDPTLALAYSNRGWAYTRLGQYEQGIADCSKAIELDPTLALAYNNRGWAYAELGQYDQAIADFDKAVELDPDLKKG